MKVYETEIMMDWDNYLPDAKSKNMSTLSAKSKVSEVFENFITTLKERKAKLTELLVSKKDLYGLTELSIKSFIEKVKYQTELSSITTMLILVGDSWCMSRNKKSGVYRTHTY